MQENTKQKDIISFNKKIVKEDYLSKEVKKFNLTIIKDFLQF